MNLFDVQITISDQPQLIKKQISELIANDQSNMLPQGPSDVLSGREIEVLKLLASGLSNKGIADKLNISSNTVITHRKNITQKTGIKSVSGLTIYAVSKNIISIWFDITTYLTPTSF